MGLREWLLNYGASARDRAQHNARALAVRRGLMSEEDAARPSRLLPPLEMERPVAGGGSSGAEGLAPAALAAALEQVPGGYEDRPTEPLPMPRYTHPITGRPVRTTDIDLPYEAMPEFEPVEPEPVAPEAEPEEPEIEVIPGRGAPVTSRSDVFGLSATFAPGTTLRGVGDPLRAAEQRALTAKIRDYNWRAGILENAARLPEAPMNELWRSNPVAAAQAQTGMTHALTGGWREVGAAPDTMLPSEAMRRDVLTKAGADLEAQPLVAARELEAALAGAGRRVEPSVLQAPVIEAEAEAAGRLTGKQRELMELLAKQRVAEARARSSMFDMTPAQAEGVAPRAEVGEGAEEAAETAPPMAAVPQASVGQGRVISQARLAAIAQQRGRSVQEVRQRAEALGYTIVP